MALPAPAPSNYTNTNSNSINIPSGGYTYGGPDEIEEVVQTEEWEEERNGVMVKVRKTTTKSTKKISRNSSTTPYLNTYAPTSTSTHTYGAASNSTVAAT